MFLRQVRKKLFNLSVQPHEVHPLPLVLWRCHSLLSRSMLSSPIFADRARANGAKAMLHTLPCFQKSVLSQIQDHCNYRGRIPMLRQENSQSDQYELLIAHGQQYQTPPIRSMLSKLMLHVYFVKIPLQYPYYPMNELLVHVRKYCMRQMQLHNVQDESAPLCKGDFESVE